MSDFLSLAALKRGESAVVTQIQADGAMGRRLLDIGLIPGTRVECLGGAPSGDPAAYLIRGAVIALRRRDAAGVGLEGYVARQTALRPAVAL